MDFTYYKNFGDFLFSLNNFCNYFIFHLLLIQRPLILRNQELVDVHFLNPLTEFKITIESSTSSIITYMYIL